MPGVEHMTNLSRRKLLAGAIATPVIGSMSAGIAAYAAGTTAEPIIAKSVEWMAADARLNSLIQAWQSLEAILFDEARRQELNCGKARKSSTPEAKAMRALDLEIQQTYAKLEGLAADAWATPATSVSGAIAKIELGFKVQGPFDWRDHAHELIEDGIRELRALLAKMSAGDFSSFR